MYHGAMREELERFVASLAIPDDRKAILLAELLDHLGCATEAARRDGRDLEQAARAALGDLEAQRRSLEAVGRAFHVTRWHAFGRGVVAATLVALVIDQLHGVWLGALAALGAIAIAAALAPPRALELLRAELRARRVRAVIGGVPIGAALVYMVTVSCAPFVIWIGLIVVRAFDDVLVVDVPWSAFALMATAYLVLLVEGVRARRAVA
jgi:hypothetical protein